MVILPCTSRIINGHATAEGKCFSVSMGKDDKLIRIASFNTKLNHWIGTEFDSLPEIILAPDYAGVHDGNIELIKCFEDNIFISIKLDANNAKYYVSTVFDVKPSKIASYVRSGRLIKIDAKTIM